MYIPDSNEHSSLHIIIIFFDLPMRITFILFIRVNYSEFERLFFREKLLKIIRRSLLKHLILI